MGSSAAKARPGAHMRYWAFARGDSSNWAKIPGPHLILYKQYMTEILTILICIWGNTVEPYCQILQQRHFNNIQTTTAKTWERSYLQMSKAQFWEEYKIYQINMHFQVWGICEVSYLASQLRMEWLILRLQRQKVKILGNMKNFLKNQRKGLKQSFSNWPQRTRNVTIVWE